MDLNNLYKLIFALTIGGSCVGVSIYVMKLLNAITENVQDLRKTVKNLGVITEGFVETQNTFTEAVDGIKRIVKKVEKLVDNVYSQVLEPLSAISTVLASVLAVLKSFTSKFNNKQNS